MVILLCRGVLIAVKFCTRILLITNFITTTTDRPRPRILSLPTHLTHPSHQTYGGDPRNAG